MILKLGYQAKILIEKPIQQAIVPISNQEGLILGIEQ